MTTEDMFSFVIALLNQRAFGTNLQKALSKRDPIQTLTFLKKEIDVLMTEIELERKHARRRRDSTDTRKRRVQGDSKKEPQENIRAAFNWPSNPDLQGK